MMSAIDAQMIWELAHLRHTELLAAAKSERLVRAGARSGALPGVAALIGIGLRLVRRRSSTLQPAH